MVTWLCVEGGGVLMNHVVLVKVAERECCYNYFNALAIMIVN